MPMNLFDSLYEIALEADDITGEVKGETAKAVGGDSPTPDENNEISTNTDDVLGLDNKDNGTPEDNQSDDSGEDGGDQDNPEGESDESSEGDGNNSEDPLGGDSDTEGQEEENPESKFTKNRKEKLRKQFIHLFDVMVDNIELVTSYVPNANDTTTIKTMTNIKDNLMQCKTIIYKTITEEYNDMEYHELLKRYISVNRIYEVSTKIMENYFNLKREESEKK